MTDPTSSTTEDHSLSRRTRTPRRRTRTRIALVAVPSIDGAFSGLIGDPTASGDGASTITFQVGPPGTHQYICPMPGHAQMGMHGAFIVRLASRDSR